MSDLRVWVDECQAWNPPAAGEALPDPRLQRDIRRLQLITQAKARGATWNTIGATLGIPGWQAKRDARKLAARIHRELIAAEQAG